MAEGKERKNDKGTSLGLEENIEAVVAYLLGWVSGLIVFLLETKSKYVRFHAAQSLVLFFGLTVISYIVVFIPLLGLVLAPLLFLLGILAWIFCLIKAYQHEDFEIPIAGGIAKKLVK